MFKLSRLFTKTEYTVAYRFSDKSLLNDTETPFKILPLNNSDRWYADPFICKSNDEYYVFMEVFIKSKGYAGIGYSKLINGELTEPKVVIDTGYHMSFPSVYQYNGKIIMIPETCAKDSIQIFECTDFPEKWEAKYIVAGGDSFYDSVLFEHDKKYFMFTSSPSDEMYGSRLYLMELKENGDSFEAVGKKELTDDSSISREAGLNLYENGSIFRVAQNCSNNDYGHAVEFLQIDSLSTENYSERKVKEITVSDIKTEKRIRGAAGIHTYNREDKFEVIDFKLCTFSVKATLQKIKIVFDMIKNKIKP